MIKNNTYILYRGLIWGATELSAGYFLHMLKAPVTGSLLMPVGIICMINVYLKTGSKSAILLTSVIAAAIKLLTIFIVPAYTFYLAVNPSAAILLEGLILVAPISLLDRNISGMFWCNILIYFALLYVFLVIYKVGFLTFQVLLKEETGAPALGILSVYGNVHFLFADTLITIFLIYVYLKILYLYPARILKIWKINQKPYKNFNGKQV